MAQTKMEQRSCYQSFPVISTWKNYCEQYISNKYSTSIIFRVNTANFIKLAAKRTLRENRLVGGFLEMKIL